MMYSEFPQCPMSYYCSPQTVRRPTIRTGDTALPARLCSQHKFNLLMDTARYPKDKIGKTSRFGPRLGGETPLQFQQKLRTHAIMQ